MENGYTQEATFGNLHTLFGQAMQTTQGDLADMGMADMGLGSSTASAMFAHEPPEVRVRHLFDWLVEDDGNRMLPASGLMPLTQMCQSSGLSLGWKMNLYMFDMECMSALMSLGILVPEHGVLINTIFKSSHVSPEGAQNLVKHILNPPCLTDDPVDFKEWEAQRYAGNEGGGAGPPATTLMKSDVYLHYLSLGPVLVLRGLLRGGSSHVRKKLEATPHWAQLKPHLQCVASCPAAASIPGLQGLCTDCIGLIEQALQRRCAWCNESSGGGVNLLRCSGCALDIGAAFYCSRDHQRAHWKEHKKVCAGRTTSKSKKYDAGNGSNDRAAGGASGTAKGKSTGPTGKGRRELEAAIRAKDIAGVRSLLKKGIHPNTPLGMGTGLHECCFTNNEAIAKVLVDSGADLELKTQYGETPLTLAVMYSRVGIVRYLVEHGADTEVVNVYGATLEDVLDKAYDDGNGLVDSSARETISKIIGDQSGFVGPRYSGPLESIYGIMDGKWMDNIKSLRKLVKTVRNINEHDPNNGWSYLHSLCDNDAPPGGKFVRVLIDARADVNVRTGLNKIGHTTRSTPLHIAAECDRPDVIRQLVKHGAKTELRRRSNHTALHTAVESLQLRCIKALVEVGADVGAKLDLPNTALKQINAAELAVLLGPGKIMKGETNPDFTVNEVLDFLAEQGVHASAERKRVLDLYQQGKGPRPDQTVGNLVGSFRSAAEWRACLQNMAPGRYTDVELARMTEEEVAEEIRLLKGLPPDSANERPSQMPNINMAGMPQGMPMPPDCAQQ